MERDGLERETMERVSLEREGVNCEGIILWFSITLKKTFRFTEPPAVESLNYERNCNSFAHFPPNRDFSRFFFLQ